MACAEAREERAIREALAAYAGLDDARVHPIAGGLINRTFGVVGSRGAFVLQCVHRVFSPEIHYNIDAVGRHLQAGGLVTPRIVPTRSGDLWVDLGEHGVWRLQERIDGVTHARVEDPRQAFAAGQLLARFHRRLGSLHWEFLGKRVGVHDTAAHIAALEHALTQHREHRLFDAVAALAERMMASVAALEARPGLPERIVHGDPKFNNVMFAEGPPSAAEAICMIDLDTVGHMPVHLELGDAWRSWCNARGEDDTVAAFDLQVFAAAVEGYFSEPHLLGDDEVEALTFGVEWITLELAVRFATDALQERYFGWDDTRFPAAGEHSLARAQGQYQLHVAVLQSRQQRIALLSRARSH